MHGVAGSFKIFTEMSNSVLVHGHNWHESIRERTVHLDSGAADQEGAVSPSDNAGKEGRGSS